MAGAPSRIGQNRFAGFVSLPRSDQPLTYQRHAPNPKRGMPLFHLREESSCVSPRIEANDDLKLMKRCHIRSIA